MLILATILLMLAIAFFADGTDDARKLGTILLLISLVLFGLRMNWSWLFSSLGDLFGFIYNGVVQIFVEGVRFVALIFVFIFLGPLLLIFGKGK